MHKRRARYFLVILFNDSIVSRLNIFDFSLNRLFNDPIAIDAHKLGNESLLRVLRFRVAAFIVLLILEIRSVMIAFYCFFHLFLCSVFVYLVGWDRFTVMIVVHELGDGQV